MIMQFRDMSFFLLISFFLPKVMWWLPFLNVFVVVYCTDRFIGRSFRIPSIMDFDRDIDANINHFDQIFPSLQNSCRNQYYDTEKFTRLVSDLSQKEFSVMHLNI